MSRTLFFYIFKDLFRIFMLTSGALAGIMSFGGLLRPLTEHGLDASQAAKMLSYFMPAMTTYSLPIAALFATTMVYGRLSADNEIVACRAAGISYGLLRGVAMPAVVLGLLVSIVSLMFLCFIVPVFTLKVERVIYSNLAQLIANQIERTHQIKFGDRTIFAQEAAVGATDPAHPKEQRVTLGGLMIVSLEKEEGPVKSGEQKLQIPKEFYLARQATVFIRPSKNGEEFTLDARLEGGSMFPRRFSDRQTTQGGLAATEYGPFPIQSVIKEDTKFMDIKRLHQLDQDLSQSRRVQEQLQKIVRQQQEAGLVTEIYGVLTTGGTKTLESGTERYELNVPVNAKVTLQNGKLDARPAKFVEYREGKLYKTAEAAELELTGQALADDQITVSVELRNVTSTMSEGKSTRESFLRTFVVPATFKSAALERKGLEYFQSSGEIGREDQLALRRERLKIANAIQSEMHARASFGVSCLILVIVGCWLGMMFRSGNFLSAFALSVMPALLCIALIVAGQHTATNIPYKIDMNFKNPLNLGIGLIWSGNVAAFILAVVLGVRLNRQ
jgi:lipopolysaccharide export LptBFGC system permease protein LptF